MNLPAIVTGFLLLAVVFLFAYFKLFRKPKKLQKIWEQIQTGDTVNPLRQLKTIIIKQGGSVDAHFLLAECYRRQGNCEMAVVEYRFCLKMNKKPFLTTEREMREGLVECFLKLNKEEEALAELFELIRLDPKNYKYLTEIGKIFYNRGNLDQAVTYFDKAVKANPTYPESLSYLGVIMYNANQIKEAMVYLTRVVEYDPRNYQAYYYLGRLYMDGRDFSKALTYFDASQRSPRYRVRAFLQKGNCYREMNDINHALEEYRKGILAATAKDQIVLLATRYALASLFESRGRLTEAIEQWEGIGRIEPNYRDIPQKLEKYQDLRADDNMKDFLVSPIQVFEGLCLDIVKHLGYDVLDMKHLKASLTNIVATPKMSIMGNVKRQRVYVKIYRDAIGLGLSAVKTLLEEAKALQCMKAICISPVSFKPEAIEFSQGRQIDLIGGEKLSKMLAELKAVK